MNEAVALEPRHLPAVAFALESWSSFYNDPARSALWQEHYDELAGSPDREAMAPDVPFYEFCDARGQLQVLTARRAGRMIGYTIVMVRRHTHYATFCGFEDAYYLTSSERRGGVGVLMIARTLEALKRRGVKKVYFMNKLSLDIGKLFEKMGFEETDRVWMKWL
jgi:GNAT superfamily N-acetyltransferase